MMETLAEKKERLQAKKAAAAAARAAEDAAAAAEKTKREEAQRAAEFTAEVYFDISIGSEPAGRITMGLYGEQVPKTVKNFHALCTGDNDKFLSYKGSKFHRIIPKFMCQGGDFTSGDGNGGESIYGSMFPDENFEFSHIEPGLLSMANSGPDTNGSQFFITTEVTDFLDGKHVVFGKVTDGKDVLAKMEAVGTKKTGAVTSQVEIVDCGEVWGTSECL
jgi:peptidylprolyl isomerase